MGRNERQDPPRRLLDGGDGSPQDAALAALLREAQESPPTSEARERVWAGVRAARSSGRGWLWLAVPAALCGLVLGLLLRPDPAPATLELPAPFATLTLTSGEVSLEAAGAALAAEPGAVLPNGTALRTGKGSRAHLRLFDDSGLLVGERSEVRLSSGNSAKPAEVALQRGSLAASVVEPIPGRQIAVVASGVRIEALGTLFSVEALDAAQGVAVRVGEGQVRVRSGSGPRLLSAGECWSSASAKAEACPPPAEEQTLRGLTRHAGQEGLVVLDGDPSLAVEADGVALGHPPIRWWTPARAHAVKARSQGEADIERAVVVEPRREVRVALVRPPPAAIPEPDIHPAPETPPRPHPAQTRIPEAQPTPAPVPAALPEPAPQLSPVPAPPGPDELYGQALRLSREGRFAEAAAAFESLSRREDRFGAMGLYELGRLRHRALKDPAGALEAFAAYRQRFPAGDLRQEVDLSVVEAALSAGDSRRSLAEASTFLATYPASERSRQIRRIRGDLSREAGDCAAALADYQAVLAGDGRGPEGEEALFGAASCEAKLGRSAAARERLQRYLELFPAGKHAAQARETLEKSHR